MHARRLGLVTTFVAVVGLFVGFTPGDPGSSPVAPVAATAATGRPNIVMITADDMRADDLEFMPRTKQLLGKAGVTFTDTLSNFPLCCPARATLLTGQYNHNNGVLGNEYPWGGHKKFYESGAEKETLPVWLSRAGYNTGFVGKYLNYYGTENPEQRSTGPEYVPPGWDDWHATVGGVFRYYCPTLNQNGVVRRHPGQYQTDLFTRLSEDFIGSYAGRAEPFFLWASHLAPHAGVTPDPNNPCLGVPGMPSPAAPRHERMFGGMPLPNSSQPGNAINEEDMSDKGRYMKDRAKVDLAHQARVHQSRLQALQSLDDSVAATVDALRRAGVLDNTLIVFTSDNGWLLGEHRAEKKILPYEESLTVPLVARGPGLPAGVRRDQPVGLVDLPSTFLDVADAVTTVAQDGTSLMPLAANPAVLARRVMPIEAGPAPDVQRRFTPAGSPLPDYYYRGVRSSSWSYIAWQMGDGSLDEEIYGLDDDPFQLDGLTTPREETALAEARLLSEQLEGCAGPACVVELSATVEDGERPERRTGDTTAPQLGVLESPRGWQRGTRATVRYSTTDGTDRAGSLRHWCSHQAADCDGTATLRLHEEGHQGWTVHVTDPAGNVGSAWGTVAVDLYRPRVLARAPRNRVVEGSRAPLPWRVTDSASGVRDVDFRKRVAGLGGRFGSWVYPGHLQNRRGPVGRTALPAGGGTVCVQTRGRDVAGWQTVFTGTLCQARALDAAGRVVTSTGPWRTVRRAGWVGDTGTTTRTRGARLEVPSAGGVALVRLVARTGPGLGRVRVDVGGRFLRSINLDRTRRGLVEFKLPTRGHGGRVRVTVVSSGRPVWVDSVGVVRRL